MTLEELKIEILGSTKEDTTILTTLVIDGVMRNKSIKSLNIESASAGYNKPNFDYSSDEDKSKYSAVSDEDSFECSSVSDEDSFDYSADLDSNFDYSDVSRNFEQLLKDNTTLEEIDMDPRPYDITEINAPLRSVECSWLKPTEIESVLARCQHLQSLTIDGDEFPQPVIIPITNLLNHLPKLSKLNVSALGDSELWVELFTILQTNQTLKELDIYEEEVSVMSDEVLLSLKNFLIHNKSIKHMDIDNNHFTNSINFLCTLTEGLSNNKTIERLSLPRIDTTTNEGRSLLNTVFEMESSLTLTLECECIDVADLFPVITSLLQQNTHIKELYIRMYLKSIINGENEYIDMTHSESSTRFEELIEKIYNHPTLEYVDLQLLIEYEVFSRLKRTAEKCLNKKMISINCISPHIKITPLIEFH